jgi:hypothetical protein
VAVEDSDDDDDDSLVRDNFVYSPWHSVNCWWVTG